MNPIRSLKYAITSKAGMQLLKVRKHSPSLLFIAGTAGVVGTVVLACRATLHVEEVLSKYDKVRDQMDRAREMDGEYSERDFNEDRAKVFLRMGVDLARLYAPALATGVVSIACLTGAHVTLNRRNVNLTVAYAAVDRALKEYRARVQNELGGEKEQKLYSGVISKEIVEETDEGPVIKTVESPAGRGAYQYLFDKTTSKSWSPDPGYNQTFLRSSQNYANDLLRARGFVLLNDVLDSLGLDRTKSGCVVGWILDGGNSDNYIDFGIFDGDMWSAKRFVDGHERSVWLNFNVDGVIYDHLPS